VQQIPAIPSVVMFPMLLPPFQIACKPSGNVWYSSFYVRCTISDAPVFTLISAVFYQKFVKKKKDGRNSLLFPFF